ncbi:MAG TPA: DegT/DnrJ/EryC1/StrS family aminotransferase [Marinobacter sp.]|uniref:DegT/DnrJ/EryC1/StrS aminotransferase n=1 Tax=marine sediment metagenome TaxID=412755 RepID=A0A0F9SDD0_9ZZZZ|nr:DegT/DnrJ/EryC1/StrS family aminotransferase [Marinobacter sp.]
MSGDRQVRDLVVPTSGEITSASNLSQIKELHDKIEAIRVYAKSSGEGRIGINNIAVAKVKAEWHGGRMLAQIERQQGFAHLRHDVANTTYQDVLTEAGLDRRAAQRWQTIGLVPLDELEDYFDDQRQADDAIITSRGVLNIGQAIKAEQRKSDGKKTEPTEDLHSGTRVYFGRPMIGDSEKQAVLSVLSSPQLSQGGAVSAFEENFESFIGGGLATAVSSCTAALHLSCMALFKPGDEVIVPALTHVATAHAVEAMGATPVFADVSRETGCLDLRTVELHVTEKTKGIMVVHYLGICRDIGLITGFARERKIDVIEDCALVLGANLDGLHVGLMGKVGCFSFYPVKHITTGGEGGMVVTRSANLSDNLRRRRHFGQAEKMGDVTTLGLNYRMTEMQAAIGNVQLNRFSEFMRRRSRNYDVLRAALRKGYLSELNIIESPVSANYGISVFVSKWRDELRRRMKARNVETSIYYPHAVPMLKYYAQKYGHKPGDFPNAEAIARETICLPVGPHLIDRHMEHLITVLREECNV